MRILPGPTKSNQALAWSPDGRWLVAGGTGDGLTAWEVDADTPGQRVLAAGHGGRLMRFCPATGRLYAAFQSGGFWDWNPATGAEREHRWLGLIHQFHGLAVSPDGRLLAATVHRSAGGQYRTEDVGLAVGADERTKEVWARPKGSGYGGVYSFAFRRGAGELFGMATHAGRTRFVWVGTDTGERAGSFLLPRESVTAWALAPDGGRVTWITASGLYVRDVEGEADPLCLPADGAHRRGLAWSTDGRVISYTTGTTVRLLDSGTLAEVRSLDWNIGKPRAVAFAPDGLRAAVSGDGGRGWVTVFDLE